MSVPKKKLETINSKGAEEYIEYYSDLMVEGYKASDVFKRLYKRMRDNPSFTATELATALCIAYDEDTMPTIIREIAKFTPFIFEKLEEKGLKQRII